MNFIIDLFNTLFTYPIFNVLMQLYHVLGDFGLAIIILAILIYLLTLPFSLRLWKDSKARRNLQPQLTQIAQLYPDTQDRVQRQQQVYKEHGISPLPPFVPLIVLSLVLMGVFFALEVVLRNGTLENINMLLYPFLTAFQTMPNLNLGWFTVFNPSWFFPLAQPDPTSLLPILTGIVTFVQMRMAQPVPETQEVLIQSAQIMQLLQLFLAVGITIFFAWQFAAGIALYRFISLLLTAIGQYFMGGWGSLWTVPRFAPALSQQPQRSGTVPSSQQRKAKRRRSNRRPRRK